ncbi:sigma-70 family RNA polymerase sigma factor [Actinoplanes sp. NPDC026623]|uniref:sigma-70 family RNA polymerase sigma factor n=1 Tax=Actinoplanes sp. NPDC026623 TaxID=3155610 RepID=UPI00340025B3
MRSRRSPRSWRRRGPAISRRPRCSAATGTAARICYRTPHRTEITEPHEQLRLALMSLSRQQRAVVVLRYYADLSERQVAEELGCSLGSVKTQNHRAMTRLRKLLPSFDDSVPEVSR